MDNVLEQKILSAYSEFDKQKKQADEDYKNVNELINYSDLMIENCQKKYSDEIEQLNQKIKDLETIAQKITEENKSYIEKIKKLPLEIQKQYIKKNFLY